MKTTIEINTNFNTIETIRTDAAILNKSAAYLAACDIFEIQASQFSVNENFVSRKSAEEVSLNYAKAKTANCEYSVYAAAHACECWLSKSWNNAD
jgi:hypothetical protein